MEILPYVLIVIVGLISGILSGLGGGGGSMLMIPLYIFLGLPAQNAVATMKLTGLGVTIGSLTAFRKKGHFRKDIVKVMAPIAVVIGLVTPIVFGAFEGRTFQVILAVVMLLLLPMLFLKKLSIKKPSRKHKLLGYSLYTIVLFIQGLFSSGTGGLATFVLQGLFGLSKAEAIATRRLVLAAMGPVALVALLISGFVSLLYGLVGLLGMLVGSHIGTKFALKKGETFISIAMAITIAAASVLMIIGF